MLIALVLFCQASCAVDIYRFDDNRIELWYQVPIHNLHSVTGVIQDTVFIQYEYCLNIWSTETADSASTEGIKGACIVPGDENAFVIDYIPVSLYPGIFRYRFTITSGECNLVKEGAVELPSIPEALSCSDLIIGKKHREEPIYFRNCEFTPSVSRLFAQYDTLFTYCELYGLLPDSLLYDITYKLVDTVGDTVYHMTMQRVKHNYTQVDTYSIAMADFIDGDYSLSLYVHDSSQDASVSSQTAFRVMASVHDLTHKELYSDIQYLVSPDEYNKFSKLDEHRKKRFLKDFWSRNDYFLFEEHIEEADRYFSISKLKGRDSERGKYYLRHGKPDDREVISMIEWGRQLELWHYHARGEDVLFCDTKNDGNPRIITVLVPGELAYILEFGFREPDKERKWPWLFDIAPGTYEDQKSRSEQEEEMIERLHRRQEE